MAGTAGRAVLRMNRVGASSPRPSPPQVCGGEGEEARRGSRGQCALSDRGIPCLPRRARSARPATKTNALHSSKLRTADCSGPTLARILHTFGFGAPIFNRLSPSSRPQSRLQVGAPSCHHFVRSMKYPGQPAYFTLSDSERRFSIGFHRHRGQKADCKSALRPVIISCEA